MLMNKLRRRWWALIHRDELEYELDEELRFHLERDTTLNLENGMNAEEARYAALRSFGGVDQSKEECRDARGIRFIQNFLQDLRFGARMLLKQPGFTLIAVLTLGLGIGANTAVFSLANALLFRPPKGVYKPDEIVAASRTANGMGFSTFSYPDYVDFRDQNQSFTGIAAYRPCDVFLNAAEPREFLSSMLVSGNYFSVLGTHAEQGRLITPDDDRGAGTGPVAVISHGLWEKRFGSDPRVVGKVVDFNQTSFTIVGVMNPDFVGTGVGENIQVWLPIAEYAQADPGFLVDYEKRLEARQISWLSLVGRLKPGVTISQAQADLTNFSRRLEETYPDIDKGLDVALTRGIGLPPRRRDEARTRMGMLLGIAGLVLLIASANVANLFLARGASRRKEFALRRALGAGRLRVVRQLATEALLFSMIGGVLGLMLAFWSKDLLLSSNFLTGVRLSSEDLRFDARVFGFALLVSLAAVVIFGLIPAFESVNQDLHGMLKDRSGSNRPRSRFRGALAVGQIALSLVVLICAGLLVRTLRNMQAVDPGFDPGRILVMPISVGRSGYSEEQGRQFYKELVERLASMPGVSAASLSVTVPFGGSWRTGIRVEGQPTTQPVMPCDYAIIAPYYFNATGIALVQGRDFTEQDRSTSPGVAIINQTFAQRLFPNANPIGKRLAIPRYRGDTSYSEIIGIARDVKYETLTEPPRPYLYVPLSQQYQSDVTLLVRTRDDNSFTIATAITSEAQRLDNRLAASPVRTLNERLQASLAPQRGAATMLGIFGVLALGLTSIGLYGLLAYLVRQRQQEIGVRMALGANSRDIFGLILKQGAILIVIGVTLGVSIGFATTRVLASFLFEVASGDPLTYTSATLTLVITALAATYLPARRAAKVDPLVALRYE